jgi:voltage-gated potassium channel
MSDGHPTRTRVVIGIFSKRLRRLALAFAIAIACFLPAIWAIERGAEGGHIATFQDAAWYALVTASTVGYGDLFPVSGLGRLVASCFILFTLVGVGFTLSAIQESVLEVRRMEERGLFGTSFADHVVVCGSTAIARTAIGELLAGGVQVAVLCRTEGDAEAIRALGPPDRLFVTLGEPGPKLLEERLAVKKARTVAVAMDDDTANIVVSLNVHALCPETRIVVAVQNEELRSTLIASGVTYVASPFELSGRLVASATFEPEVARFIEDVTSGIEGTHDLHQLRPGRLASRTVAEIRRALLEAEGPLLVAVAKAGKTRNALLSNPPADTVVGADDWLVLLGTEDEARRAREQLA